MCNVMLSQIAMEMIESSHVTSSIEQYPGDVPKYVETQHFLDYILTVSWEIFPNTQPYAIT